MNSPDRIDTLSSLLSQFQRANAQLHNEKSEARERHDAARRDAEARQQQTLEKIEALRSAGYQAYNDAQEALAQARLAPASTPASFIAPEPVGKTDYFGALEDSTKQIQQISNDMIWKTRELREARLANRRWFRLFVVLGIAVIIAAALAAYLLGPRLRETYLKTSAQPVPALLVDVEPLWVREPPFSR